VVGAAWGETIKQLVSEWEPWSGLSADEARVEDGTKASEVPRARVGDQLRLSIWRLR